MSPEDLEALPPHTLIKVHWGSGESTLHTRDDDDDDWVEVGYTSFDSSQELVLKSKRIEIVSVPIKALIGVKALRALYCAWHDAIDPYRRKQRPIGYSPSTQAIQAAIQAITGQEVR